ncbi:hypothetical protein [Nocardioides sp. SYSU DS0663]|uniref:hypothetical protein n=1 Tax=Nocardioides sp. SYSU DS0663 TaxID=3416445 RepID=UPI003F4B52BD
MRSRETDDLVEAVVRPALPVELFGPDAEAAEAAEAPAGTPGTSTGPLGPGSVLWCAGYRDLQAGYPRLPQAHDQEEHGDGSCVDVMIEVDADGRLSRADVETLSVGATFAELGDRVRAARADALLGADARTALPLLAELLRDLFAMARAD